MAKHEWEDLPATQENVSKYGWEPRRKCKLCGAVQQREQQQVWMRVTGYRWLPLVGRCPGKKPKKAKGNEHKDKG